MPGNRKMSAEPEYHGITRDEITEFRSDGVLLRVLTGEYHGLKDGRADMFRSIITTCICSPEQKRRLT